MFKFCTDATTKTGTVIISDDNNDSNKYKVQVRKLDNTANLLRTEYTYDYFSGIVIPLQMRNGKYEINVQRNYFVNQRFNYSLNLHNPNLPFLSPNVYVNYDEQIVSITPEFTADQIAKFIKKLLVYDQTKADLIKNKTITQYVPDLREVVNNKKGICFDYASLFAAILRSKHTPCKLIFGRYQESYHAWNEVLCNGEYIRYDLTFEDAGYSKSLIAKDDQYIKEKEY